MLQKLLTIKAEPVYKLIQIRACMGIAFMSFFLLYLFVVSIRLIPYTLYYIICDLAFDIYRLMLDFLQKYDNCGMEHAKHKKLTPIIEPLNDSINYMNILNEQKLFTRAVGKSL